MFGIQGGMTAAWVILMIIFLVIAGFVPGLVSVWLALVVTRPLAKKYVNSRTQATNADMLIGQECIVKETIDALHGTGAVSVAGKEWTARSAAAEEIIEEGAVAVVERIEGVKLIVRKK